MSNTDSFIEEVTEEVRRDRLYAALRRYGWVGVLAVLLIVGGAAFNEWRKAQDAARAEAFGDALLAALDSSDQDARLQALAEVEPPSPAGAAVQAMLRASELLAADRREDAAQALDAVADQADAADIYRDVATLKALLLAPEAEDAATRRLMLDALAAPGNPLRLLAQEQIALIQLEAGDRDAARATLAAILEDAEVTNGLRRRAGQILMALGGAPEAG